MDLKKSLKRAVVITAYTAGGFLVATQAVQANEENLLNLAMQNSLKRMKEEINININPDEKFTLEYNKNTYDPLSAVHSYGCRENDQLELIVTPDAIDMTEVGRHPVLYRLIVTDNYGQKIESRKVAVYTVKDTQKPVIEFENESIEFQEGASFEAMENVKSVKDPADGELEESEKLSPGKYVVETDVDNNVAGTYEVKVQAMDINGNVSEKTYAVIVTKKPKPAVQKPVYQQPIDNPSPVSTEYTMGSAGRITCGGYSAALEYGSSQGLIDMGGVAAYGTLYYLEGGVGEAQFPVIFDHAYQGFDASIYNNTLYITHANGVTETWTKVWAGCIDGAYSIDVTFDENGIAHLPGEGQLITQTCSGSGNYVATWSRIG